MGTLLAGEKEGGKEGKKEGRKEGGKKEGRISFTWPNYRAITSKEQGVN